MKFKVIDKKAGKEADAYEIALQEEWAKGLVYCDIEGFAITEDGELILADECGKFAYCPDDRFEIQFDAPTVEPPEHEQLLKSENEVILRRLKHLLESDYISQFDRVDPNTKEYIRDIREADRKVTYLCDKEKPCKDYCEKDHLCKRTSDISHAKNFRLVPNGIDPIIFEEVDEHCIANVMFDREELEKIIDERVIEPIKNGELVIRPHEWIPVNERLPEDMQRVLVWFEYYRYGDYNCMYQTYGFGYVCDGKWSRFINGETGWQDARIIAWMTLPEAYKEADND